MREKIKKMLVWLKADRKRVIGVSIVVFLLLIVTWRATSVARNKPTYQTATVTKGTVVSTVSASGKALTTNILAIDTQASGVVKKVYVKDGDKVYVGQKIAEITLDSSGALANARAYASLVSAQNSVNSANNNYRSTQATLERVDDEVKGHDTDETFTQKETRTKAEVANDNAYDSLKSASANLTSAQLSYRLTAPVITAPATGTIESVNLVEGMVLSSSTSTTNINSQRAAVIKGSSYPVVNVSLSEVDVPKINVGQKATVIFDSLSDKTFSGTVATIDRLGTVSNNVTSYSANIRLDSMSNSILPNMAATANIILETKSDVLMIPSTALITQNGTTLAKTLQNGTEVDVPVEVGISSASDTEITSGLTEGQVVIIGAVTTSSESNSERSVFSTGFGGGGARFIGR
jgi:RND family efflux transporter MFP subunit